MTQIPHKGDFGSKCASGFAKYRRQADGCFAERSLQEYLVLASVFETCGFNNVNILKFSLSRETTLEGLLRLAGRRAKTSREVRVNHDSNLNHTVSGSSDTQNPGHDDRRRPKDDTDFSPSNLDSGRFEIRPFVSCKSILTRLDSNS